MTALPCPICQQADLRSMLEFDNVPVTGIFPATAATAVPVRRLEFGYCPHCAGVTQLPGHTPPIDYVHVDRPTARQLPDYVETIVERIATIGRAGGLVLEVGCNDGNLLTRLRGAGCKMLLGIEPSARLAALARLAGHAITALPLTAATAQNTVSRHGVADAVICRHTLEHVPNPREFVQALRLLLRPNGHLALEVPSLAPIIERIHIHELWDEHISYFLPENLVALLRVSGFDQIEISIEPLRDSESIICHARAGDACATEFSATNEALAYCASFRGVWEARSAQLRRATAELTHPVVVLGASHPQANFLNFSGIAGVVDIAIDDDPFKIGKYLPLIGHNVPIRPSATLPGSVAGGTLLLTGFGYPDWMDSSRQSMIGPTTILDMRPEALTHSGM